MWGPVAEKLIRDNDRDVSSYPGVDAIALRYGPQNHLRDENPSSPGIILDGRHSEGIFVERL